MVIPAVAEKITTRIFSGRMPFFVLNLRILKRQLHLSKTGSLNRGPVFLCLLAKLMKQQGAEIDIAL